MEGRCWPCHLSADGGEACARGSGVMAGPAETPAFFCLSQPPEVKLQLLPSLQDRQFIYFPIQYIDMSAG